jgi:hypothetical protein
LIEKVGELVLPDGTRHIVVRVTDRYRLDRDGLPGHEWITLLVKVAPTYNPV